MKLSDAELINCVRLSLTLYTSTPDITLQATKIGSGIG